MEATSMCTTSAEWLPVTSPKWRCSSSIEGILGASASSSPVVEGLQVVVVVLNLQEGVHAADLV